MEILINNKAAVIHETIIVDGVENIVVDITMASCDQYAALNLKLILLSLLFLFYVVGIAILLRSLVFIKSVFLLLIALVFRTLGLFFDFYFIFLLFFIRYVKSFQNDSFKVAVAIENLSSNFFFLKRVGIISFCTGLLNIFIFVCYYFNKLAFLNYCDTLSFEPLL